MKDGVCNICGATEFKTLLKIDKETSIVKCAGCNTARTYPYPKFNFTEQEKYSKFYLENENMFRMFASSMMDVVRLNKGSGSILDIGCSVGYLLDAAKEAGFTQTYGIELNKEAARISRDKGHAVYDRPLEELGLEKGKYSVVVFNHVLEHIPHMKPFLSEVRNILKDDGIVYCGAPNYNSLMQKWLRSRWYGWGMPDHVWHFEVSTFRAALESNGFHAKAIVQNAMYYPYSKSLRKNTRATVARLAGSLGLGDQVYGIFLK
jgi:SAM-dependent methyltransferase